VSSNPADILASLLAMTRDEEMDCDAFAERVAAYVDGSDLPREAVALLEHHRLLCTECDEHVLRLVRALELAFPANTTGC
jgi:hypothetical protein